jgi:predicted DNA-binding ribbon-helix-helix protein
MRTTIKLPESVYRQSEQAAHQRGFSVEQFIVRVLERELAHEATAASSSKRVSLPLIASKHPGTLDLARFDFDDLLA